MTEEKWEEGMSHRCFRYFDTNDATEGQQTEVPKTLSNYSGTHSRGSTSDGGRLEGKREPGSSKGNSLVKTLLNKLKKSQSPGKTS